MYKIKQIEKTCDACPAQWEAELEDGKFAYFRYRWGTFRFGIGNDISKAVSGELDTQSYNIGEELDGCMTNKMLKDTLSDKFEFPEDFCENE